ncbi:tyrosine-type recombinase/integrase [Rickettsiella endosymbiont of Dermanyssus gallinae]|uniref:tyrosine-type recombinase/integrase n=1 Tax=Rickettsiella endosymbiont of Dermanyssus gallinae TaxID=2856608 RepID=UPI001C52D818|nr:integrase family protein [Rickettsiella endosymbiont of Dermanyssus gallinae]
MKLTKIVVDKLQLPTSGNQKRYYDSVMTGFGVRVTAKGAKAFFVEKMIKGKQKRLTIGRYPALTVEQARKEAQKLLGKIATGVDPIAESKASKQRSFTLQEVFNDYINARKSLKPSTILDYQRAFNQVIPDWLNKSFLSITKEMVFLRHEAHGKERSESRANDAMRVLRALFNFAMNEYEDDKGKPLIFENPVKRLSHKRAWYRIERRQSVIKRHELAQWYQGLQKLTHRYDAKQAEMMKDYFLFVLFTGLRREEAATVRWENVDFKDFTLTVTKTKNGQVHTLPLSTFLYELLLRRKNETISDFVFPATNGKKGHLTEPRKAMLKVAKESGIEFTVHDLRRTFITLAESLDIPVYVLKRLLNHALVTDVTAGYVVINIERLRKPMQLVTDALVKLMGIEGNSAV